MNVIEFRPLLSLDHQQVWIRAWLVGDTQGVRLQCAAFLQPTHTMITISDTKANQKTWQIVARCFTTDRTPQKLRVASEYISD